MGMINAILLDEKDNVVTCVKEVQAGEEITYRSSDGLKTLKTEEPIPYCHKVALTALSVGDEVIKYGEMIGKATAAIAKGCHVNENNIISIPRDYDSELV